MIKVSKHSKQIVFGGTAFAVGDNFSSFVSGGYQARIKVQTIKAVIIHNIFFYP